MNDRERRKCSTVKAIISFYDSFADSIDPQSIMGKLFSTVKTAGDKLATYSSDHVSETVGSHKSANNKSVARDLLLEDLKAIARTSISIGKQINGFSDVFVIPYDLNEQQLLDLARSFAKNAAPNVADFVARDMQPDFLDHLNADITAYEQILTEQHQTRADKAAANALFHEALDQALAAIDELKCIVPNKFKYNTAALAAWKVAVHTQRAPRPAPAPAPVTPEKV
jgi:hypothetical protein